MSVTVHPLLEVLTAAAVGRFPPVDGAVAVLPPDDDGTHAVVAFTGHAVVLGDVEPARLAALGADGYGGALHPDVQRELAGGERVIGSVDVVLVARAGGGDVIAPRHDADEHPRVRRARAHRRDVAVYGDAAGLVVLGTGLVGRRELSVELTGSTCRGDGRRLIAAGLATCPPGEWCFAQVAAGNTASLRAFLACGFVPICAEVLITPR